MWFDGEWESTWSDKYGKPLYDLCRKLQPNVLVNNRVSNGRGGMEDSSLRVGDFSTPEQFIPPTGLPGLDWETCMTMNDHWGYNAYNDDWKSSRTLIRNLADIASKGGNYLLNVGPKADGTFPTEAIERLRDMGAWMRVNGEAIYGTTASHFENLPWGRSTTKGSTIYLHVFDWPKDGKLVVPGLANKVASAKLLSGGALEFSKGEGDLTIQVPAKAPDEDCTVVAVEVEGSPLVYRTPKIVLPSNILVDSLPIKIESDERLQIRYTLDGTEPVATSPVYQDGLVVNQTATIRAAAFSEGKRVSSVVSATVEKVAPRPADLNAAPAQDWKVDLFEGAWDKLPDFDSLTASLHKTSTEFEVPTDASGTPLENIGAKYQGYVHAPHDGVYLFELTADDGANLWIGDRLVVDNDGLHEKQTKTGAVALAAGWHKATLGWFNRTGGAALSLKQTKL
jgi:alpha-L-fucosidase